MAKQSQKNESDVDAIEFNNLDEANTFIENVDLRALGKKHRSIVDDIEDLSQSTEKLTIAIRKVLSSKQETQHEKLRKRYQKLFDDRADKSHMSEQEHQDVLDDLAVLKRATRSATDKDAKKRNLWAFDYSITCNTIKNNGIAKFDQINHEKASDDNSDDEAPIVTDFEQVWNFCIHHMNASDFRSLASIVETRFQLEAQNVDSDDIIFVDARGKKPAHFEQKVSA